MTLWAYFEKGPLESAGLDILDVLYRGHLQKNTRYRVRFSCCGTLGEITHKKIREREQRKARHCLACIGGSEAVNELRLGVSRRDHGVVPPTWPRPEIL